MLCVACEQTLPDPLYTFGDYDAPMCQSCYLGWLDTTDPYAEAFFSYEDVGNGVFLKRLTRAGAIFLEGTEGQIVMAVKRA